MDPLVLFNAKMLEFCQDLVDTFPEDNDFKVCQNLVVWSLGMDKTMPQRMFNQHVAARYHEMLMHKNEAFFLNETFDPSVTDVQFVTKLKQIWVNLDDSNKDAVWKYMQLLAILNKKVQDACEST